MSKYAGNIITTGANAGYSVAFDGTGDYATVATNAALAMGSGNFTIEFWFNSISATSGSCRAMSNIAVGGTFVANTWAFALNTASFGISFYCYNFSSASPMLGSSNTALSSDRAWHHCAVTRSGNTWSMFVDGVLQGSAVTSSVALDAGTTYPLTIGWSGITGDTNFNGNLSNLRLVKGTALYTSAFTPPTQLFNISGTSFLTCNSPSFIDQSSTPIAITTVGDTKVSTFTPFTGYSATPPNPNTQSNTSGVWSVSEAEYWMAQNKWPMPYPWQSLRFNSADLAYLSRTPTVTSNRRTFTWSGWVKRTALAGTNYAGLMGSYNGTDNYFGLMFTPGDNLSILGDLGASPTTVYVSSPGVLRDLSAWYHIVMAIDTTQAVATDRRKLWINGVLQSLTVTVEISQNLDTQINTSGILQTVGSYYDGRAATLFDGYMADVNFVDGLALTASSFGQTDAATGAWIPQNYTGSYGTNGYRLTFQNNTGTTATTLGKDWSGVGNNWTPNNFSVSPGVGNDSLVDSPWNFGTDYGNGGEVRGNYCTLNPLNKGTNATITNGNLDLTGYNAGTAVTIAPDSGKYYWEMVLVDPYVSAGGSYYGAHGIASPNWASSASSVTDTSYTGFYAVTDAAASPGGGLYQQGVRVTTSLVWATNDIIGLAYDAGANTLSVYRNGTIVGSVMTVAATSKTFNAYMNGTVGDPSSASFNFGQRPFAYKAPSGYKALCTTNLPTPAIGATSTTLASKNMNIALYTGNGTSQAVTGYGFQPDLVWFKARTGIARNHVLFDAVRGANQSLSTSATAAEATWSGQSFLSDGFTVDATFSSEDNASTISFVGWGWKGGNGTVSNTSGSITSTVSANPTSGFSVITYTGNGTAGATVGHGLGVAPSMVIVKSRGVVGDWQTYHTSLGATKAVWVNLTNAAGTSAFYWNNTAPSSTVLTLGTNIVANTSTHVAYCFAPVAGFSSFGVYTGNGSADGPFVYLGFRPRFIMLKRTDAAGNWYVFDTARGTYNIDTPVIYPNSSAAEVAAAILDFLSNGFKIRSSASTDWNASGGTYIYAAFAETPFNYSRAR